jgi:hypothetical protein
LFIGVSLQKFLGQLSAMPKMASKARILSFGVSTARCPGVVAIQNFEEKLTLGLEN